MQVSNHLIEYMAAAMNPYWFEDNAEGEFPEQVEQKRRLWRSYAKLGLQAILTHIRNEVLEEASMTCFLLRHEDFNSESEDWKMGTKHCALAIRNLKDKTDDKV